MSVAVAPAGPARRFAIRVRIVLSAAIAAFLGVLPHVLHHVGPLAGAALFAGVGGSLLFGAIGLVAAIPFLIKVRRRCGNWRVPALLLTAFALIFAISTFVVGPAISGGAESDDSVPVTAPEQPGSGHLGHH